MIRVAVIMGGRSNEHSVSCVSATTVVSHLDPSAYEISLIGITRAGHWVRLPDLDVLGQGPTPEVPADLPHISVDEALAGAEVAFPVLHGPFGEDGCIQGLLETLAIPYVGSGVLASAVAMDKSAMKAMFQAAGLPIGPYRVVTAREWSADPDRVARELSRHLALPCFVKPARAGSSQGISKVVYWEELALAMAEALTHDPKVLVEQGISGREIECGLLGPDDDSGRVRASVVGEIVIDSSHAFYDYAAKYGSHTTVVVPADLEPEVISEVQDLSRRAFQALGCEGYARADFFVTEAGDVLINELNTIPGFTTDSLFPRLWQASGIPAKQLTDRLVRDAVRRGTGLR